ncbi:DNA primase [Fulvitalea axinellae]|uniref:DNA primase n=1 Tax=Fulvitalea axinellae TaxID=1182444 RepID=A0AAU9D301_9BACT|nr:DNA primase [Fulvitalea axinellae]
MGISQYTIQTIRERADIEDVVSDFLTLKKKGGNLWACCPFHDEKTPSFSVAPAKGIYKCFGCGASGDSINFVMELEGLSYPEAIRYLGKKYGIDIEETDEDPAKVLVQKEKDGLMVTLNFGRTYFEENLWRAGEGKSVGLSYFKERGFTEDTIRKFQLGYSMSSWDGLLKAGKEKGFTEEQLEKAGLIITKEERSYDRFRSRVVFPIHNLAGKAIAFGARILTSDKNQPKYLNSPETEAYVKSKVLYGIHQAKNSIRRQDNCYLVEGYTDVISLHQAGVENVVASSGTSLTEDQIRLIGRFTKNVTVLFDGDAAGIKASLRGIDMILAGGMNVRVVAFPEGEDPDSYARKLGGESFQSYLEREAVDFITFKTSLYVKESEGDPVKRAETIKSIVGSVAKVPDTVKRAVYLKECARLLEIEEKVLLQEMNRLHREESIRQSKAATRARYAERSQTPPPAPPQGNYPPPEIMAEMEAGLVPPPEAQSMPAVREDRTLDRMVALQERESLRLLLNYGLNELEENYKLCDYILSELEGVKFTTPAYKEVLELFKKGLASGIVPEAKTMLGQTEDEEVRKAIVDVVSQKWQLSPNWMDRHQINVTQEPDNLRHSAYTGILRLKLRMVTKMVSESMTELRYITDEIKLVEQLRVIQALKKAENEIGKCLGVTLNR